MAESICQPGSPEDREAEDEMTIHQYEIWVYRGRPLCPECGRAMWPREGVRGTDGRITLLRPCFCETYKQRLITEDGSCRDPRIAN
jgi:hypothetical protein